VGNNITHDKSGTRQVGKLETQVEDRGRVTIPAHLRRDLGITKGEKLEITSKDGAIILKRKSIVRVADIRGIIGPFKVNIEDIKEAPGKE
jgi:AbrB family looped-hinge helix DNA binding protein